MKPRKAGAMDRSLLGVGENCSGELPLVTSHPQHRGAAESGTRLGKCFLAGPVRPHMVSIITVGSGFLVACKYAAKESEQASTPRPRCRSSFREPYNFRMHATVGVGLAADRKRRRSPTARDTDRYADSEAACRVSELSSEHDVAWPGGPARKEQTMSSEFSSKCSASVLADPGCRSLLEV